MAVPDAIPLRRKGIGWRWQYDLQWVPVDRAGEVCTMRIAPFLVLQWLSATTVLAVALLSSPSMAQGTWEERRLRAFAGQADASVQEVRSLLARGVSPNVPDSNGRTAVHAAAAAGALDMLRAILAGGGNPRIRDKDGGTPLHLASDASLPAISVRESISAIRLLLQSGADANGADAGSRTPLHLAARSHDLPGGIAALLRAGANPNATDREGNSPLHAALGPDLGWPGSVSILLDGGADPLQVNGAGLTALQLFVRQGQNQRRTAALLIEAGADPDRKYPDGDTPLHVAIRNGAKANVVEALLEGGADPCVRDAGGNLPYGLAPEGGSIRQALANAGGEETTCGARSDRQEDPDVGDERLMRAAKRSNVRSGPGTEHGKVGLLEVGDLVRVTGEVGQWFRIELPDVGTAFVFGPLLEELDREAPPEPFGTDWSFVENQPCQVWNYGFRSLEPFTWSGACVDGRASGEGRLTISDGRIVYEGAVRNGRMHGYGTTVHSDGNRHEGQFRDGQPHGHGTKHYASGDRYEGEFRAGKRHGRGSLYSAGGGAVACDWQDDEKVAGSCVAPGQRVPGHLPGSVPQPVPDAATRWRVAEWMDRCDDLWTRQLLPHTNVRSFDLLDERDAGAFLESLNIFGGPVDAAWEYVETCVPVSRDLRHAGRDQTCGRLGREIERRIGGRSTVLREASSLLGTGGLRDRGLRRTVEDYLHICVPAIAAGMDQLDGERRRPFRTWRSAARERLRQGAWLFPGTVASSTARDRMIQALGHALVSGQGRSDSRRLMQVVEKDHSPGLTLAQPPPYEFRDVAYTAVVSQWGSRNPESSLLGIPQVQYVTYQESNLRGRNNWIGVQHAVGRLRYGEFGITRTTVGTPRGDQSGEAGFVHYIHPAYGADGEGRRALNIFQFLVFQKGATWQGDVLGFKVDGNAATPVYGTVTLEVTEVTPPFPDVQFGLVIDWNSGEQIRVECRFDGSNLFASDRTIGGPVLSGRFLGRGAEEALATFSISGYAGSFGLRRQ